MKYNAEQVAFMLAEAIDQNREYKSWHCSTQHLMALVERVVAEEREACAIVCDDINAKYKWPQDTAERVASQWCADAIRARGNVATNDTSQERVDETSQSVHEPVAWEQFYPDMGKPQLALPQRTWVGLTEDEAFACQGRDYFETYKAIEAKLKEKNT